MGFGECIDCGNAVERPGWDETCFTCQEEYADTDEWRTPRGAAERANPDEEQETPADA